MLAKIFFRLRATESSYSVGEYDRNGTARDVRRETGRPALCREQIWPQH